MLSDVAPSMSARCSVCNMQAFGLNYGVLSCNACKMFFRRVILTHPCYQCRGRNSCYKDIGSTGSRPKCRACRFQRCLEVGMRYTGPEEEDPHPQGSSSLVGGDHKSITLGELCGMIKTLLIMDSRRAVNTEMMRSDEDPTIHDVISKSVRGFSNVERIPSLPVSPIPTKLQSDQVLSQWSFFGIWTSIEFLNSLDFMSLLRHEDKQILLRHFALNSYLLASAFRSSSQNSDLLINPDGTELVPTSIVDRPEFSKDYVDRVQKMLVGKLTGLRITSEEYILATVILFCNPALYNVSQYAQQIVSEQQRKYCNALLKYCKMTRGERGPGRCQEILSLSNVMGKCFEDVQYLNTILQCFYPSTYNSKKLLHESIEIGHK